MKKEDVLEFSRLENKDKDLVELEVSSQAGNIASTVGAGVCCLVSAAFLLITGVGLCSTWIIYFSIIGTQHLVKFTKLRRKKDLVMTALSLTACIFFLALFVMRLAEAKR